MTTENRERIRENLRKDGINFVLYMNMTDSELEQADSYEDYDDYNRFMNYMARKYHI